MFARSTICLRYSNIGYRPLIIFFLKLISFAEHGPPEINALGKCISYTLLRRHILSNLTNYLSLFSLRYFLILPYFPQSLSIVGAKLNIQHREQIRADNQRCGFTASTPNAIFNGGKSAKTKNYDPHPKKPNMIPNNDLAGGWWN